MKHLHSSFWFALAVILVQPALAATKPTRIPPGAKITLELDRKEFFLGENILAHYCVENIGGPPFDVNAGGDYRGGTRANRFKVSATSAAGKPVLDPDPVQWEMGGLMGGRTLTSGGKWYGQVWLPRYCWFEEPDVYTVRVYHDLGWGEKLANDPREVTATLRLERPSLEQAKRVVDAMFAALHYGGPTEGKKSQPMADFRTLRDPVYLPIMAEYARQGVWEGLVGLEGIATPKAAAALIDLFKTGANQPIIYKVTDGAKAWLPTSSEAQAVSMAAALLLLERLPLQETNSRLDPAHDWKQTARQKRLRESCRPEFAPAIRSFGLRLLAETNRDNFVMAARLLDSFARAEDLPVLLDALDAAVRRTSDRFQADHGYPEPVSACNALARLCARLAKAGSVKIEPTTPGRMIAYAWMLETNAAKCPPGWDKACLALLKHDLPYVRAQTLAHLPRPLPASILPAIGPLLFDADPTVQNRAFLIAREIEATDCRESALKVLASAKNQWLFHAAFELTLSEGANYECAQIWARRFDENLEEPGPAMSHWAMMALWRIISGGGHISGGFRNSLDMQLMQTLKARWTTFVEEHKEDLKARRRFTPEQVPKELLPEGWRFYPPETGECNPRRG